MSITPAAQEGIETVYRRALVAFAGTGEQDAETLPLPVLRGIYGRFLSQPLHTTLAWSAVLSRPDMQGAGIHASTRIHEVHETHGARIANLPPVFPAGGNFSWSTVLPIRDLGLEQQYIGLLGRYATMITQHDHLKGYYSIAWRSQLLLELVSSHLNGGPTRFQSPETRERYGYLLGLLAEQGPRAAVLAWIDCQAELLQAVGSFASFPQVSAKHGTLAIMQSQGYRPRELWRLTERVMVR